MGLKKKIKQVSLWAVSAFQRFPRSGRSEARTQRQRRVGGRRGDVFRTPFFPLQTKPVNDDRGRRAGQGHWERHPPPTAPAIPPEPAIPPAIRPSSRARWMTCGRARPAGEFANLDHRASSRLQVCFCLARSVLNKLEAMLKSQDAPHKNPDVRLPLKEGDF